MSFWFPFYIFDLALFLCACLIHFYTLSCARTRLKSLMSLVCLCGTKHNINIDTQKYGCECFNCFSDNNLFELICKHFIATKLLDAIIISISLYSEWKAITEKTIGYCPVIWLNCLFVREWVKKRVCIFKFSRCTKILLLPNYWNRICWGIWNDKEKKLTLICIHNYSFNLNYFMLMSVTQR